MGNEVSGEGDYYDDDEDDYAKQFDGIETLGYRVLGVQPDSPAAKAGLVSFFDFIVGANHKMLLGSGVGLEEGEEYDDVDFPLLLKENIHNPVLLLVYNIKAREQREVQLIPSDDWGGAGLLGVTIKLDDYGGADEKLVRVLEVDDHKGGPAKVAGLIEKEDFLLGTTATTLTNTDVLASLLQMHLEQVVELYVYNSTTDLVRIVGLHPTYNWGYGESMLGAAVGTGYLHRLPESCRSTIGKSVERTVSILEDSSGNSNDPNQLAGGVGELNLNQSTIRMEGTLEMEPEDEDDENEQKSVDGDVGLAASRGMQVQPHRLGQVEKKMDPPNNNNNVSVQSTIEPPATPDVKSLPPPPPETPFPEAAPLPPSQEAMPTFSTPQPTPPPPPPPPPPAETSTTQVAPPPPPPPPEPVPPTSPDPPASNENDDDDEYTDEEGSEYTDEEYTDDEEETPKAPRSGGLFGFMAPPPKMEY